MMNNIWNIIENDLNNLVKGSIINVKRIDMRKPGVRSMRTESKPPLMEILVGKLS